MCYEAQEVRGQTCLIPYTLELLPRAGTAPYWFTMNPQTRKVWIFICLLLHQPHTQRVLSLEQSDTADGTGIVFNRVKTVILAEQYEYASFLLPYPAFQSNVSDELRHAADIVTDYWNAIPGDCPAFQDRAVKDTQAPELLNFTQKVHDQAQHELQSLKMTSKHFFSNHRSQHDRRDSWA